MASPRTPVMHNEQTTGEYVLVGRRRERSSGGAAFVMVMKAADVGDLNNRAAGWRLCGPRDRRILVQREVGAPLVIVIQEKSKRASKRPLIPHDDMIETLVPEGPDQALDVRILPRGTGRDQDFLRAKTLQQATEVGSVAAVAIADQIRRRGFIWKRFADLLPSPRGGRMVGYVQMNDTAAVV